MNSSKRKSKLHPADNANIFSKEFHWWTLEILKKGHKNNYSINDLSNPRKCDESHLLGDKLEKSWKMQLSINKPDLWKAIFSTFWKDFLTTVILAVVDIIVMVLIPLDLGLFLHCFSPESTATFTEILTYALTVVLLDYLSYYVQSAKYFRGCHLNIKVHVAVSSLIYRKAVRLSKAALNDTGAGKVVNLLTHEVGRYENMINNINILGTPLCILIMACILYYLSGCAGVIGLLLVIIISALQVLTGYISIKYRQKASEKSNERISLIDEIISGVLVMKMYTWEKLFASHVKKARSKELQLTKKASYFRNFFWTMNMFIPRISMYITLILMLEFGHRPTVPVVFVIVPFFFLLNDKLLVTYKGLADWKDCMTATSKIQNYLLLDEFASAKDGNFGRNIDFGYVNKAFEPCKGDIIRENSVDNNSNSNQFPITMDNVSISWNKKPAKNILERVNLKFERGKLYMVIGTVGSGKTSLLSSILKEIKVTEGNLQTESRLSYAGQDPWIFGDTIQQNILFGEPYDRLRYDQVLKVCCLGQDMKKFANGDRSVVGEKGISLSGGQKARINLARAIYRQADIYLLDDPLSAVDARVSKRLFEECVQKFLRNKTRILATHQLHYIRDVDGIILVDNGSTFFYKSYNELLQEHSEYRNLIAIEETKISTNTVNIRSFSMSEDNPTMSMQSMSEDESARRFDDTIENIPKNKKAGNLLMQYLKAGSNWCLILTMIFLFIATQAFACISDGFVLVFTNAEEHRYRLNHTANMNDTYREKLEKNLYPTETYTITAMILVFTILIVGAVRSMTFDTLCIRSSKTLHDSALDSLLNTKLRFFHTNPSGRILNRFSKDILILDEDLPCSLVDVTQIFSMTAGAIFVTCVIHPVFAVPAIIIVALSYWLRGAFVKSSEALTRMNGMTKAPIFTHLSETLNGIATIRAFQAERLLIQEFDKHQDLHTSVWYTFLATKFAFSYLLKSLNNVFILTMTLCFVFFKDYFEGGQVGLAITQVFCMTGFLSYASTVTADAANHLRAVERLVEYAELPKECDDESKHTSPDDWPEDGEIEFQNVTLRYSDDEDPVLKFLNFRIEPQEKIGIVGRTGAGKSSLISALFRLSEIEGLIKIDGVDTGLIALDSLRSRISIIPQDPVLFSGTLRQNLDPFGEYVDSDLWSALEQVELKKTVQLESNGLDSKVLDKGANYSIGQRQLICLARAILRKNRILVLDEATANVDPHTDLLIQETIRTKFKFCTVLTVAHRLNTIVDSDKVIVMDNGYLVEFDHPYKLLKEESGYFTKLVKEVGDTMFQQFFNFAKLSYKKER